MKQNKDAQKYITSSIYSYKKSISEYNNLFEPERLNQFCSNILQAFNKLFIFSAIKNNDDYLDNKNKVKSFDKLKSLVKTKGNLSKEESFILDHIRSIRNDFHHNITPDTDFSNSFHLISALVTIYKILIKKIANIPISDLNLISTNRYGFKDTGTPLSKKLEKLYSSSEFKNYSYEIGIGVTVSGVPDDSYSYIVTKMEGSTATEVQKEVQKKFSEFKHIWMFSNIWIVLGIVNKEFKPIINENFNIIRKQHDSRYVVCFKKNIWYTSNLIDFITMLISKNNVENVNNFFKKMREKKKIVNIESIIQNNYDLLKL